MEDRLRALFAEFRLGRSPSPMKPQQGESSERPTKKEEQATDLMQPRMRVDFPRWEEEDSRGWLSRAERYFRYHQTPEASMVDIAAIHLEEDVIQCRTPSAAVFLSSLICRFQPTFFTAACHCRICLPVATHHRFTSPLPSSSVAAPPAHSPLLSPLLLPPANAASAAASLALSRNHHWALLTLTP
ncbi:hypothetical protein GW17_00059959 [Ensete ventricosum]|nr:hypothetical protein GW17_00059959 [Ensete ventricosum]